MSKSTNINDLMKKVSDTVDAVEAKNTKTINDKVYKIKLLRFEDGIDLWENILKKLMPSLGSGLDRMQHDSILDGSPTTFTDALIHLSKNLDGNTLKNYSFVLFNGATVDGKPLDVNVEFTGNYSAWKKLFTFALTENFSSFFEEGWSDGMSDLMAVVTPAMNQPTE